MLKIRRKGQSIYRRFYKGKPDKMESFIKLYLSRMNPAELRDMIYGYASPGERVKMDAEGKIVEKFIKRKKG